MYKVERKKISKHKFNTNMERSNPGLSKLHLVLLLLELVQLLLLPLPATCCILSTRLLASFTSSSLHQVENITILDHINLRGLGKQTFE